MFPVHIKHPGVAIPTEGTCFIIAREGILLRRETSWMHATVPVDSIGVLDSEPVGVQLKVPLITNDVIQQVIAFLRAAYQRYRTEAIALLYYSDELGWHLDVPTQKVSRYTIASYDAKLKVPGYKCLGSIHSHADVAASHSGVDHADEAEFDGIHITVGHCQNQFGVSVSAEVVVNGNRFGYPLQQTEGLEFTTELAGVFDFSWDQKKAPNLFITLPEVSVVFPPEWLDRIEVQPIPRLFRPVVVPADTVPHVSPELVSEIACGQQSTIVPVPDPIVTVAKQPAPPEPTRPTTHLSPELFQRVLVWLNSLKLVRRK